MIIERKVTKIKLPILYDLKLRAILPSKTSNKEKLDAIKEINDNLMLDYKDARFIYNNFKLIGAYMLKNKEVDFLYIIPEFQNDIIDKKINKIILRKKVKYDNEWVFKKNG